MLVKPVPRSVMPAGNCIVWSMEFSQMDRCRPINVWVVAMTRSTPSLVKLVLESMCPELSWLTWSQLWSVKCPYLSCTYFYAKIDCSVCSFSLSCKQMKSEPAHTDNCSTLNSWSPERKMPPTITLVGITQLAKKSWISCWTESENWLTNVPACKVS